MNKILEKALAGALSGFFAAVWVDIDAFKESKNILQDLRAFNWRLAGKRYLKGIGGGIGAAFGLTSLLSVFGVVEGI